MIEICDNGEKLVDIEKVCSGLIIDLTPKRKAYFRESVAKMICRAKSYLPKGVTFIIGDAWRSQKIQKDIHKIFCKKFKREHPRWSDRRIKKEINEYVAPYKGRHVSGHMVGGAVDLRLYQNGRKVPMKSGKLSYQENALSSQLKLPKYIQKNRKLMFSALKRAGLSNYKKEYWHWSYGDLWWAKRNHKTKTVYGPIEKLD